MDASRSSRMGIVTDVDDNYNYVWSDRLGPCELRYPHNPDVNFEPGEIIGYIQTKRIQYDQNPLNLTKEDPHTFDDYTIEKTPTNKVYKWRAQVCLTFAPYDSEQYRKTMEIDSDYLRGVAYAEDFLFLSDQLMMVPCYHKKIQYEEGAVYKAYITRIQKGYDSLALKIGSIFLILEKDIQKVTNEQTIQRVLRKCPWNKIQSNIFGRETDDKMPSEIPQKPTTSNRQSNQSRPVAITEDEEDEALAGVMDGIDGRPVAITDDEEDEALAGVMDGINGINLNTPNQNPQCNQATCNVANGNGNDDQAKVGGECVKEGYCQTCKLQFKGIKGLKIHIRTSRKHKEAQNIASASA